MPSRDLAERIGALGTARFEGSAYRHVAPAYDPLATLGARIQGGRWNPPDSFGALYLALDRNTAIAEFRRLATRQGLQPADFLPRDLHTFQVRLTAVLDLTAGDALKAVGLDLAHVKSGDRRPCQAVGEAANRLGLEGVLAQSATGRGEVLVVLLDRLTPESLVEVVQSETLSEL